MLAGGEAAKGRGGEKGGGRCALNKGPAIEFHAHLGLNVRCEQEAAFVVALRRSESINVLFDSNQSFCCERMARDAPSDDGAYRGFLALCGFTSSGEPRRTSETWGRGGSAC